MYSTIVESGCYPAACIEARPLGLGPGGFGPGIGQWQDLDGPVMAWVWQMSPRIKLQAGQAAELLLFDLPR